MMDRRKLYERGAHICLFLFFASLTNSIFVNQLGYYGALLFLLLTWYETKEKPFVATGLELPMLLYLSAELLAFLFSSDKGGAFQNFLKRAFLMPIVYVVPALLKKEKLNKQLLVIAVFALIGMLLYLVASYRYILIGEYQRAESGPSLFQYPITAAEIMTFLMLFFFSLALEKGKLGTKRILMVGFFIISALAVFATYKKTGWLGGAAGIVLIIFMQRKWFINVAIILLVIVMFSMAKNASRVSAYTFAKNEIKTEKTIATSGLALDVQVSPALISVSDYTNGVLLFDRQLNEKQHLEIKDAVNSTQILNDTGLAIGLVDTRIILCRKSTGGFAVTPLVFLSPGFTVSWKIFDNILYVLDKDSGLTVFPKLFLPEVQKRYEYLYGFESMSIDSSYLALYSPKRGVEVYQTGDLLLERPLVAERFDKQPPQFVRVVDKHLLYIYRDSIVIKAIQKNALHNVAEIPLQAEPLQVAEDDKQLLLRVKGDRWFMLQLSTMALHEQKKDARGMLVPYSLGLLDNSLAVSEIKRSPLLRFFDMNHPSNTSRLALWRAGIRMFKSHPLFGVGDIDLARLFIKYKRPFDKEIQGHLHNNFFHILATLGLFGFCAFLFLIYKLYKLYYTTYCAVKGNSFYTALAVGGLASITAFLVAGLTEWDFGDHEIITILWLITALMVAIKGFALTTPTAKGS